MRNESVSRNGHGLNPARHEHPLSKTALPGAHPPLAAPPLPLASGVGPETWGGVPGGPEREREADLPAPCLARLVAGAGTVATPPPRSPPADSGLPRAAGPSAGRGTRQGVRGRRLQPPRSQRYHWLGPSPGGGGGTGPGDCSRVQSPPRADRPGTPRPPFLASSLPRSPRRQRVRFGATVGRAGGREDRRHRSSPRVVPVPPTGLRERRARPGPPQDAVAPVRPVPVEATPLRPRRGLVVLPPRRAPSRPRRLRSQALSSTNGSPRRRHHPGPSGLSGGVTASARPDPDTPGSSTSPSHSSLP